ncbi:MAG TPA: class I SAM-dependent methyltransferase [Terriglobia bacterium]|nr:class I SAM-dependent methyltransferase [Terriglobia bacterium]
MVVPKKINLGSGKDYRRDYLNIDINDYWSPDIVTDISGVFLQNGSRTFTTKRFGEVTVANDSFDEIIATDVLEHVADLVTTMTNCLNLLRTGGLFNILVPYDLSYGAWQDPTHVRAFNERSWLYYTDWFWYVGWQTHRFTVRNLEFMLSPVGQAMVDAGQAKDVILRTPRTVDSMKVSLEKIVLSDQDLQALRKFNQTRRAG